MPDLNVRPQPILAVRDVRASQRWYANLLGLEMDPDCDHSHIYERLYSNGQLILQLHAWEEENHPNLVNADSAPVGHGVLVWFEVDDFDAAVARARALGAVVVEEPHVNAAPNHREMWIRDLDGYFVVFASPDGEAG
jgi:catechol 2,3-dioxygenase-like lactoylglutathione lyase family enzyme